VQLRLLLGDIRPEEQISDSDGVSFGLVQKF
jgi:hypothetical protein